jgi:hypothetical protein
VAMNPYFLVGIIIVVAVAIVVGIPALASCNRCCSQGETRMVCFREWMKAFAPLATLVAACFAAFAVIAAWQNLTEVQKGSAVRISEILRQRLIAVEREASEFKSVDLINLYKTLHDPSVDTQAWRSGNDAQRIALANAKNQLSEQFDYLTSRLLDVDTADLAETRAAYEVKIVDLLGKIDVIISGPVTDKPEDVASWRALFSVLREFYGKEFAASEIGYLNDRDARIGALHDGLRKTEDSVLSVQ